jgi:hypothetical protein
MPDAVKFTLVRSKIRVDYCGGPAVMSPKTGSDKDCCCAECEENEFEEMTLEYSACHGCERAVFGVLVSFDPFPDTSKWTRIGRVNLNTSLATNGNCTSAPATYINEALINRIIKKRENKTNCCTLYVRLKCELDGGCHSDVAALRVSRNSDGKELFNGVCGESPVGIDICPDDPDTDPIPI